MGNFQLAVIYTHNEPANKAILTDICDFLRALNALILYYVLYISVV